MSEKKYKIIDEYGHTIATGMSLYIAIVLIKGYADTYYNELLSLRIEEINIGVEGGSQCRDLSPAQPHEITS